MFKGLKSKLEDEAKRLQATVSQYGENLASQVRSSTSEAGSDVSGKGRKIFDAINAVQQSPQQGPQTQSVSDAALISFNDDEGVDTSPSLFMGQSGSTGRQRRFSNASLESDESSFSALNLPPHTQPSSSLLETISSDVESNAGSVADLTSLETFPQEKLSSIFQRLKGRAVDYKQKYRELVKLYQEIERENEKYRTVLVSTQDKALKRISKLKDDKNEIQNRLKSLEQDKSQGDNAKIKKLQDLLIKCKDEITVNRQRITALVEENAKLQGKDGDVVGHSDVDVEQRISAEWKGRFDRQEEEWNKRLCGCEEKASIAIATSKAEMHSALQQKDLELEKWITKCHSLEKQDKDANVRWQEKVDGLQKAIVALEQEKADMVQKLSQAKQEGVKLVKESEERRYSDALAAELRKNDDDWSRRMKELEEQMQLAMEENDLQRKTSMEEHKRITGKLSERIEEIEKENAQILLDLRRKEEELKRKEIELKHLANETANITDNQSQVHELGTKLSAQVKHSVEMEKKILLMEKEMSKVALEKKKMIEEIEAERQKLATLKEEFESEKELLKAKINDKIVELQEKAAAHEEISIQFEELEDKKSRLSNENAKLQDELVKVLKEADQIQQSNLNAQKIEIEALQAKLAEVLSETKIKEITMKEEENNAEKQAIQTELRAKMAEYEEMTIQLHAFSEQNLTLKNELTALKEVEREQLTKIGNQQKQLDTLQAKLEQTLAETARGEAETFEEANKSSENHQLMEKLAESNEQKEQLSKECMELKSEIAQLKEETKEQRQKIDTLQTELETKAHRNTSLEVSMTELESMLAKREATEDGMQDKFQIAINEKQNLLEEKMALQHELSALNEELQLQRKKCAALETELETKAHRNTTLEVSITELESMLAKREATEDGMQDKFQMAINEKQNLLDEKMALQHELSILTEEVQLQREKCAAFETELETTTAKLMEIEANVTTANEQVILLQNKIEELELEKSAISEEKTNFEGQIAHLKEELQRHQNQQIENERALGEKLSAYQDLENTTREIRKKLEENEEDSSKIRMQLDKINGEKKALAEENATIKMEITKFEVTAKQQTQKIENFESELEAKESTILKLQKEAKIVEESQNSQKANFDERLSQLANELTQKKQQNVELQNKLNELNEREERRTAEHEKEINDLRESLMAAEEAKTQYILEVKTANNELRKFQQLDGQMKERTAELEKLQSEISTIEQTKDKAERSAEEYKQKLADAEQAQQKAIEKARKEADKAKQKAINDLQSEIRQLYNSINEKDCELAANHATISKLEEQLCKLQNDMEHKSTDRQTSRDQAYSSFGEAIDLDEVLELKRKLADQEDELRRLKSAQQESNGVSKNALYQKRPELKPKMSITSDHLNFAEPTEAEYLRNVIYRYMTERENLGRESVTLAKVICTVCKFPPEQLNLVLRREEARCQGWLPGTVQQALTLHNSHHHHNQNRTPSSQISPNSSMQLSP